MANQIGYVSLVSPPAQTTALSDTALTFSEVVTRVTVQNNTNDSAYVAFDSTASPGALQVLPGQILSADKQCATVHLYTNAAQFINGTSANGIVVLGEV